jgi:hypothetical protein
MADDDFAVKKELSRKVSETAHAILHKHLVDAELSARETRVALDAVYDCVSGLVDWDIANLLYNARKELGLE